jgi:glycosyltransferase involved in cell wall biosynthesis
MSLAILHTEASAGWGGQELRILDEAAGMRARGHDVQIAAPAMTPIVDAARQRGIPVHAAPVDKRNWAGLRAILELTDSIRPDVIITHSSTDSWLAAVATRLRRQAPKIVRTRHLSTPISGGLLNRWLYGTAAAFVVTTGEAIRQMLIGRLALNPARVISIPTGVDLARFRPAERSAARHALGLGEGGPIIGIVATLRSWKGHRFLIDAMDDPRLASARLIIVGDGPQDSALRAKVAASGLSQRVLFAGRQDEVTPWLQAFDVCALPSTGNEGVPQALVQSLACGIPVVATPVGGVCELVHDSETGLLVPPQDVDALAGALARLLSDPVLIQRLGTHGRRLVETNYTNTVMLDAMEKVLHRAAAGDFIISPK